MKKREETAGAAALMRSAAMGGSTAILLALVLAGLCALAVMLGALPEGRLEIAGLPVTFLAVLCGSLLAARSAGQKRLLMVLGATALYVLAALLGKTAFHLSGGEGTAAMAAAQGGGAVCAWLLSSRKGTKRR